MVIDLERIKRLTTAGYPLKSTIVYCPRCPFQHEPQTCGKATCPDCRANLHVVTVDAELLALTEK